MGQKPFPGEEKLRFIVERMDGGASDAEIQDDLVTYGASGKVESGHYSVFGEVGSRTLHNIRRVHEITREMVGQRINAPDSALTQARRDHLEDIRALLDRWRRSFDAGLRPTGTYRWPPSYGVETESLFPYVLHHCPSVNGSYTALCNRRTEYHLQSSGRSESQSRQWQQTFIEAERKLKETLEISLLSYEYVTHKCGLCLGRTPSDRSRT